MFVGLWVSFDYGGNGFQLPAQQFVLRLRLA